MYNVEPVPVVCEIPCAEWLWQTEFPPSVWVGHGRLSAAARQSASLEALAALGKEHAP